MAGACQASPAVLTFADGNADFRLTAFSFAFSFTATDFPFPFPFSLTFTAFSLTFTANALSAFAHLVDRLIGGPFLQATAFSFPFAFTRHGHGGLQGLSGDQRGCGQENGDWGTVAHGE
ncbi:hypothetical protein [Synechococcus sp. RSCCF101]|uniref:hypothetical protein n=1 Tax=Synechococcus sp. RSCCF101 TaxID=2511069 RepID=UPI001782244C|nr:hypothetical protein [Synechococcus sp. RSCCF101]